MPPKSADLQVYDDFLSADNPPPRPGPTPAQDWLHATCVSAESVGTQQLFQLLRGRVAADRTVTTLNRARALIGRVFPFAPAPCGGPVPTRTAAAEDDPEAPLKARAAQYLYQRVLHRLLARALTKLAHSCGATSFYTLGDELVDAQVGCLVDDGEQQLGLVHACLEVVHFVHLRPGSGDAFPALALRLGRFGRALELWQGVRWALLELAPAGDDQVPGKDLPSP
jgi:hypothetical protein